jgi:DNA-binding XRE family transcriptional regulator
MKKPHTKNQVKLVLYGPKAQKNKLLNMADTLDFTEEPKSVLALDALNEYVDIENLQGVTLRVHRENANYTQKALAEKLGIKQHHISEMENNKRPIGKELAKKIAGVFNTDYREYL